MNPSCRPQWQITFTTVGFVSPAQIASLADATGWTVTPGLEPHTTEIIVTSALDGLRAATEEAFAVVGRVTADLDLSQIGVRACPWTDQVPSGGAMHPLPLVGAAEVAEILGVSQARVHRLAGHPGFPEPQYALAAGKLWEVSDIYDFSKAWDHGPDDPRDAP